MYTPGRINKGGEVNPKQVQRELDLISKETNWLRNLLDSRTLNNSSGGGGGLTLNDVKNYFQSKRIDFDTSTITNSSGQITQIVYKRDGSTAVTEAITYNAYGNVSTRTFTGEVTGTWTYSYSATDNQTLTGVVKS